MPQTLRHMLVALRIVVAMTIGLGILYPLVVTGLGQAVFHQQANGSLMESNGKVVGSKLITQKFTGPQWFHSRASAADYDGLASGGTNLAPSNPALVKAVTEAKQQIATENAVALSAVPADAVTSSASGLDPDISPQYASIQIDRVTSATGLPRSKVAALVAQNTSGGSVSPAIVNVVTLNEDLVKLTRGGQ
ncbi:MAG: potassium-transporting ATPase subunit KdpC [Antricoccus sp.]